MSAHGFICECRSRRCRRRIYLGAVEYQTLSRIGIVMSAECAEREDRPIVTAYNGYRVVAAANRGKALV